jgi:hypothetical protein
MPGVVMKCTKHWQSQKDEYEIEERGFNESFDDSSRNKWTFSMISRLHNDRSSTFAHNVSFVKKYKNQLFN